MGVALAEQFFVEREVRPPNAHALFNATRRADYLADRLKSWFRRSDLPGRPHGDMRFRFRGHADSTWGLSSTLYRAIAAQGRIFDERAIGKVEQAILEEMRAQGLGRNMTDGELLMVLQHHAVPTRLIDVTTSARVTLYFAVAELDGVDGRLFVIGQRKSPNGGYPSTKLSFSKELPWQGATRGSFGPASWRESVLLIDDPPLDPRIVAQRGRFLVGGMIRRLAGDGLPVGGSNLSADELSQVTTLRIMFPQPGAKEPTGDTWPAVGWTIRIPASWKPELRQRLHRSGVSRDHLFPDFEGCRRLAVHVARREAVTV